MGEGADDARPFDPGGSWVNRALRSADAWLGSIDRSLVAPGTVVELASPIAWKSLSGKEFPPFKVQEKHAVGDLVVTDEIVFLDSDSRSNRGFLWSFFDVGGGLWRTGWVDAFARFRRLDGRVVFETAPTSQSPDPDDAPREQEVLDAWLCERGTPWPAELLR